MKIFKTVSSICVVFLGLGLSQYANASQKNVITAFQQAIGLLSLQENTRQDLLETVSVSRSSAIAVSTNASSCFGVAVAPKRKSIPQSNMRSQLSARIVSQCVKNVALQSIDIESYFSDFNYAQLLVEYAQTKLIAKVASEIVVSKTTKNFYTTNNFICFACTIPLDSIKLKAIEIAADKDTIPYYVLALTASAEKALQGGEYEKAAHFLLEIQNFHKLSSDLFIDLYKCYMLTKNFDQAKILWNYLDHTCAKDFSYHQYLTLAEIASQLDQKEMETIFISRAKRVVSKGLSVDMLLEKEN